MRDLIQRAISRARFKIPPLLRKGRVAVRRTLSDRLAKGAALAMNFAALPQRISHAGSPIWATVQGTTEFPRSPKIGSHSLRAEINFDGTKRRIEAERTNTTIRSMSYFSRLISRTEDRKPGVAPRVDPLLEFDFQLHADPSEVTGPHWFELAPGPYERKHWQPGSRFISEFTFCLIEGIFERHAPAFDHFSYAEVPSSQWKIILADLAILRAALVEAWRNRQSCVAIRLYPASTT